MQIIYPLLFQDQVLTAKMVQKPSAFSYEDKEWVLEVDANGVHVQVQSPAEDCILIAANAEESATLREAGYKLSDRTR